ncbi:MAG: hypothetical protein ACOVOV_04245, partial [Dolichospermum sp.]
PFIIKLKQTTYAKAVNAFMSNSDTPDLSIRVSFKQSIRSSYCVIGKLKSTCFDIYGYNLPMIAFLDLGAHLRFINLFTTSGKFFLAVEGWSYYHWFDPVATFAPLF